MRWRLTVPYAFSGGAFTVGQFAWRLEEEGQFTGYLAASDARKDGHAAGI